jgi:hypothetical protein
MADVRTAQGSTTDLGAVLAQVGPFAYWLYVSDTEDNVSDGFWIRLRNRILDTRRSM